MPLQGRVDQQRHGYRNTDPVVGAKAGAVGFDDSPLDHDGDGIPLEVVGALEGLLADHVLVALEGERRAALAARSGLPGQQYVPDTVLPEGEAVLPGPLPYPLLDPLLLAGAAGYPRYLLEDAPDDLRLQPC